MFDKNGTVVHRYTFPLGGPRWMECEYRKYDDFYAWAFKTGGLMSPDQWPEIIARGLAGTPRFGNHLPHHYSVARHSQLMSRFLREYGYPKAAQALAAIHDAAECLGAGDMNTFLKRAVAPAVRTFEGDLIEFLIEQLGFAGAISQTNEEAVHLVDQMFGKSECRLFDMQNGRAWEIEDDNLAYRFLQRAVTGSDYAEQAARDWLADFNAIAPYVRGEVV